jgi:hypothetical protein
MNSLYPRWLFQLANAFLKTLPIPHQSKTIRTNNMIPIEQQDQELFWLKRRIKYLESLHSLINQLPDDVAITKIERQYSKVATPKDLIERIEEVYEGNLS